MRVEIPVVLKKSPFQSGSVVLPPYIPSEELLSEYLQRVDYATDQLILIHNDDEEVAAIHADSLQLTPHSRLFLLPVPEGNGGRIGGKVLQVIGTILLFTPFAAVGVGLIAAGTVLTIVSGPPKPKIGDFYGEPGQDPLVSSITGIRNKTAAFSVVPKIYGTNKIFPVFPGKRATQYTEFSGQDQYLRFIMVFGYGPLSITDIKLGDASINNFQEVSYNVREGWPTDPAPSIYTKDVDEVLFTVALTHAVGWQTRTTGIDAEEITVDLTFPQGLTRLSKKNKKEHTQVDMEIEYKRVSSGTWVALPTLTTVAATTSIVRNTKNWSVAKGQYDVRIRRTTPDSTSTTTINLSNWTSLKTFRLDNVLNFPHPVAFIEGRIRANEQLSNLIENLNAICTSKLIKWDTNAQEWTTVAANTANPAWAMVDILTGVGNPEPNALADLNQLDISDWAIDNDAVGREFNYVFSSLTSTEEALTLAMAAGQATYDIFDGKFVVVRDTIQTTPKDLFTPRTTSEFKVQKILEETPHGLICPFLNQEKDYQQDEIRVFRDGYDAANATQYRRQNFQGVTHSDQIWKMGRYWLAGQLLRPEIYSFKTNFSHLKVLRGDYCLLQHDVLLTGLGASRIDGLIVDGTDIDGIVLEDSVTMEAGKSYAVVIRMANNSFITRSVTTVEGTDTELTFSTPIPDSEDQPSTGDLVGFGISGSETIEIVIDKIEPYVGRGDLNARITAFPYSAAIVNSATGPIPPFNTKITLPGSGSVRNPPLPSIVAIRSDETVLVPGADGSLQPQVCIAFTLPSSQNSFDAQVQARYRIAGSGGHWNLTPLIAAETSEICILAVEETVNYEFSIRAIRENAYTSGWTGTTNHVVLGKTTLPPDVQEFLVVRDSDGQRVFSWKYETPPLDLKGFKIRYQIGTGGTWATMQELHEGFLLSSPYETNQLAAGTYTVGIKAFDTSLNESVNASIIESTLGDPRLGNSLLQEDVRNLEFPGVKTNCFVDGPKGPLENAGGSWDDLSTTTWDENTTWNFQPSSPITYEHTVIDLGAVLNFTPLITVIADGTVTISEAHSTSGTGSPAVIAPAGYSIDLHNGETVGFEAANAIDEDLDTYWISPPGSGGTVPTVRDSFAGSSDPLASGDGWVTSGDAGLKEDAGLLKPATTDNATASTWNTSFDKDQGCSVTVGHTGLIQFSLHCRQVTSTDFTSDHYQVYWKLGGATDSAQIWRRKTGAWTNLSSTDINLGKKYEVGDKCEIKVTGTTTVTIQCIFNDVVLATETDSSVNRLTNDGYCTVNLPGNEPNNWVDNFLAGEYVAGTPAPGHTHHVDVDLGAEHDLVEVRVWQRQNSQVGRIKNYTLWVAPDNFGSPGTYTLVKTGQLLDSTAQQTLAITEIAGRFVRIISVDAWDGGNRAALAELKAVKAGSGFTSFAALDGSQISAQQLKIKVSVAGASPNISVLRIILNAEAQTEEINDLDTSTISSPAGTVVLPLRQAFSVITSVQLALQNVGAGWTWELINKSTAGPTIKIYNSGNTLADATIDAIVRGVK